MNIVARPWEPQDLIDDLQMLIDEEPDNYLNFRRTTMCMARDYLKEHFAEPRWISVDERLPEKKGQYLVYTKWTYGNFIRLCNWTPKYNGWEEHLNGRAIWYNYDSEYGDYECKDITHWMSLPDAPEEDT